MEQQRFWKLIFKLRTEIKQYVLEKSIEPVNPILPKPELTNEFDLD